MKAMHPLHWRTLPAQQAHQDGLWLRRAAITLAVAAGFAPAFILGALVAHFTS